MFGPIVYKALQRLLPPMTWDMPDRDAVYLTFDDGPTPEVTPWVLETLAAYGVKATFFCLGRNVDRHPDLFRAILEGGHQVGNHSYSHIKGWGTEDEEYVNDVELGAQLIGSSLYRPPYGRITRRQADLLAANCHLVMGSVLSGDYNPAVSPERVLRNVTQYVRGGSIVVFHDSRKAYPRTRYALPRAIEYIRDRGYLFRTLSCPAVEPLRETHALIGEPVVVSVAEKLRR